MPIPPPATGIGFRAAPPKTEWDPNRFFRWRCYRDYGTGVAGDLFVHLFSGLHFITGAQGPTRVFATGGLRFWKDGRDVPDVLVGFFDYPETASHPAFNLVLRVNFVSGAEENSGFRFTGTEGIMSVGKNVTLYGPAKAEGARLLDWQFSKRRQEAFMKQYRQKYPRGKPAPLNMRHDSRRSLRGAPEIQRPSRSSFQLRAGRPLAQAGC